MALLILVIVVGLAIGIWLGLPGRYEQTPEDLDKLMTRGGGTRQRREKRSISPLAWVQRNVRASGPATSGRRGFKLEAPGKRAEGSQPAEGSPRPAQPPALRSARDPEDDEPDVPGKRTRHNLREGRFKLRPPGEGGPS